jgi:hypothetical protein
MKKLLLASVLTAGLLGAETRDGRLWRWSVRALVAANVADAASSFGQTERNMILGPRFVRSAGIKFGVVAVAVAGELALRRRHPEVTRPVAIANLVGAAALVGVTGHNIRGHP